MPMQKEMRTNRQVRCASAEKQSNLTTYSAALLGVAVLYLFMTFGLGHVFGVI